MSARDEQGWHTLACVVNDTARPTKEREKALVELRPFHVQTARRVAASWGNADPASRDDAIGEVELRLWRGEFTPTMRYAAWCYRTMRNVLVDSHRKRQRFQPIIVEPALFKPMVDGELFRPFAEEDLRVIRAWPALDRVLLLCQSLLWLKIVEQEWETWLMELNVMPPFPPDNFPDWSVLEKNDLLFDLLGFATRNSMNQRSSRGWKKILQLDFVRRLRDER